MTFSSQFTYMYSYGDDVPSFFLAPRTILNLLDSIQRSANQPINNPALTSKSPTLAHRCTLQEICGLHSDKLTAIFSPPIYPVRLRRNSKNSSIYSSFSQVRPFVSRIFSIHMLSISRPIHNPPNPA